MGADVLGEREEIFLCGRAHFRKPLSWRERAGRHSFLAHVPAPRDGRESDDEEHKQNRQQEDGGKPAEEKKGAE